MTPVQNKVMKFVQDNKQFQLFLKPLTEAKEENQLVFCNYNLVKELYRYSETQVMTSYWKWHDRQMTMWDEVEKLCRVSQRHHFYEFKVPMELPSRGSFNMHTGAPTTETAKRFETSEAKFLLDFWKWLNPETRELSALSKVSVENFSKINIMFLIHDGRSTVLNLGFMNSWIKGQPNKTDKPTVSAMLSGDLQTIFLKFLMVLQSYNVEIDKASRESETKQEDDRQTVETNAERDLPVTAPDDNGEMDGSEAESELAFGFKPLQKLGEFSPTSLASDTKLSSAKKPEPTFQETDDTAAPLTLEETLKQLEEETKSLDDMEQLRDRLRGNGVVEEAEYDPSAGPETAVIQEKVFRSKTPQERLVEQLDAMAAAGTITAADYRKNLKTLEAQATKPDPYGTGKTLLEASTVMPEDLQIDEKKAFLKTDERVLDKSMGRSVVESLDRDYIRQAMAKDVMACIMAVQGAGVIVTNIETEIQHSALGSFERHALSFKPLRGQSSTVAVKFPRIDEDGTFKANGVRYHMRKQRVDAPIRKIAPDRVALSSYYGKLFVFRSPKKSDSAMAVVIKRLTLASIGGVENIPRVTPANVFDNKFEAPFIYNAIANNYKGFELTHPVFGKLSFNFEHRTRTQSLDPQMVALTEKKGARLVGHNDKGSPIFVTMENEFFVKLKQGDESLGDIFDLLELDRTNAPVDPAMMKVMGRTLPVGIVLARALGFRGLLKLLSPRYRMIKARQRANLEPHEYIISFQDHSFIFDRRDEVASLILSGFDVCGKQLKSFPAASYDLKEVYDELLDGLGAGVMTCRELDQLEPCFVDPITKGLLHEMKEPETLLGLLVRSSELLTTYHHPDSQDMAHQTIRGYERFAGAIYRESMRSIRTFRNKNISGRSKVEMSPYAVWQGIMEDASVKTCEDINPIQNLKMHESVTFVGEGGRSKEAFMKDARAFTENDAGIISEASVDSGDVGINIFLSGNPRLKNLRGQKEDGPPENDAGHYLSTSLLMATGAAHDD